MASKGPRPAAHSRSNSAVVPAIPRLFERKVVSVAEKAKIATNKTSDTTLEGPHVAENGIAGKKSQRSDGRTSSLVAQSESELPDTTKEEPDSTPRQAAAITNLIASPTRRPRVNLPRSLQYQQSISFPPLKNEEAPEKSHTQTVEGTDVGATPTTYSHRKRSVHKIAFGSFGGPSESSDSSPTIPLSAASTHDTQPTPISETRSQTSRSENGHTRHDSQQEGSQRPPIENGQSVNTSFVGPYPPGFISGHAVNFAKYQQQFLAQHVQELFRRNDGDLTFDVIFKSGTVRYNLHSAIVTQSPMFAKAAQHGYETRQFTPEGKLYIPVNVQDRFVTATAVETILKSMYGIMSFDMKALSQPYLDPQFFLSLFAAGCLLAMPDYQIFASNCIVELLSWRVLPAVFELCLTGQHFPATRDPYPRRTDELVTPIFQPQAVFIFERAMATLLQGLNSHDFMFDKSAPNLPSIGGLPHSDADPDTLKQIPGLRSGVLSNDSDGDSASKSRVLSCLLLSFPLPVLQRVLAEMKTNKSAGIIELVIHERQLRREKWSKAPGQEELGLVKEICIPVDILPNGLGLINEIS